MKRMIAASNSNEFWNSHELVQQGGFWYISDDETGEFVYGPFDNREDASSFFEDDSDDDYYEEDEYMTEEEMAVMQHEKYLSWFDSYTQRLPGKFYIDGYVCSRNYTALERFVKSFNRSHSEAGLEIETRYDSEGPVYLVM